MLTVTPYRNFELCLLDWSIIEPFWQKNDLHSLDRECLVRAYHQSWFHKNCRGDKVFVAGAIIYDSFLDAVVFINGRHRTNLLLLYSHLVPLAVNGSIFGHPVLRDSVLKRGNMGIEIELPRLRILHSRDLDLLRTVQPALGRSDGAPYSEAAFAS